MIFDVRWFTVVGLILDLLGAVVLLSATLLSKKRAIDLGVSRWAGKSDDENLNLPQVQDRLLQSRRAKWGLILLACGFALQVYGAWPR